jgi:hypothetical protein
MMRLKDPSSETNALANDNTRSSRQMWIGKNAKKMQKRGNPRIIAPKPRSVNFSTLHTRMSSSNSAPDVRHLLMPLDHNELLDLIVAVAADVPGAWCLKRATLSATQCRSVVQSLACPCDCALTRFCAFRFVQHSKSLALQQNASMHCESVCWPGDASSLFGISTRRYGGGAARIGRICVFDVLCACLHLVSNTRSSRESGFVLF